MTDAIRLSDIVAAHMMMMVYTKHVTWIASDHKYKLAANTMSLLIRRIPGN